MSNDTILYVLATVFFLIDALPIPNKGKPGIGWTALGFAMLAGSLWL